MVVNTADGLGYLLSASAFLVKEGPCWNCFLLQKIILNHFFHHTYNTFQIL